MFPGAVLIALFCVRLIQACENAAERIAMTLFLILLLFFMGTNMYTAERTRPDGSKERILTVATNPEKVSDGAKRVADILLAIEDSPNVVSRKKYVFAKWLGWCVSSALMTGSKPVTFPFRHTPLHCFSAASSLVFLFFLQRDNKR